MLFEVKYFLLIELIAGAEKVENMQSKDTISKNWLFFKESISLIKIHIDGADFHPNYEGWEKFKSEDLRNYLVRLNIKDSSLL